MSEIKLNQEVICALQNCKDAKSIMTLAKRIAMSEEQAEKIVEMFQNDKLSDKDLEKVIGGNISTKNDRSIKQCDLSTCWH